MLFKYFADVVHRSRVSGGNQIRWNYLKKSKPFNYDNLQVFIFHSVFNFEKSFFNCFNSIARERRSTFSSDKQFLKLLSAIFYQIFIFLSNDMPPKTEKCFLFHLKSFSFSRYSFFVFFSFPFTIFRFKRASGSGIIYDVINWLA